jgi:hypothetical protein
MENQQISNTSPYLAGWRNGFPTFVRPDMSSCSQTAHSTRALATSVIVGQRSRSNGKRIGIQTIGNLPLANMISPSLVDEASDRLK